MGKSRELVPELQELSPTIRHFYSWTLQKKGNCFVGTSPSTAETACAWSTRSVRSVVLSASLTENLEIRDDFLVMLHFHCSSGRGLRLVRALQKASGSSRERKRRQLI